MPEESKTALPALITPEGMQLKINTEVSKNKLTVADLEKRALALVRTEDNLKVMAELLADLDKVDKLAESVHKTVKVPYWDAGKACDAGKNLVLSATSTIRLSFKPAYDKLLKDLAERKRLADLKTQQDAAILTGIENNTIAFAKKIVEATTKKQLLDVEFQINQHKSPSMAKKYGEFHAKAIERYDTVLIPIIKSQKDKIGEIEKLNTQLQEAENQNDPDKMDELMGRIDGLSDQVIQSNFEVTETALNQGTFAVMTATEVLPDFKVKRTNYSMEIADVDVAFKKARHLLEFSVNKDGAKEVLEKLKKDNAFEGKDEIVVDGIKYIATRIREAL